MEIFKKIVGLIFLVIIFLVVATGLPKLLTSNTTNANTAYNEKWYDSAHYLNEYYTTDSGGNYDTGTGYRYYLADSQDSPVANAGSLAYSGASYYESDYGRYAGDIYTQYENSDAGYQYYKNSDQYSYDNPNAGYRYYKKYKSEDGFADAWDRYVLDN